MAGSAFLSQLRAALTIKSTKEWSLIRESIQAALETSRRGELDRLLSETELALGRGDNRVALDRAERVLERDQDFTGARLVRARALLGIAGRQQEAIAEGEAFRRRVLQRLHRAERLSEELPAGLSSSTSSRRSKACAYACAPRPIRAPGSWRRSSIPWI